MFGDEPEPPTGPMKEHAARAYLELCKETVLYQERVNKEYSTKASILLTFAMALAGTALIRIEEPKSFVTENALVLVLSAVYVSCFILIVVFAFTILIRPLTDLGVRPGYGLEDAEEYLRATASGAKVGQTLIDGAEYYRARSHYNSLELWYREFALVFITWAGLAELLLFFLLIFL